MPIDYIVPVKCLSCGCDGNESCGSKFVDKKEMCTLDETLTCKCCVVLGKIKNIERWENGDTTAMPV